MSSKDVDCPIATANTPKAPGMITTTHWLRTPENHIYYCSLSCRCPILRQYTLSSCCAWWQNSWDRFTCQASRRGEKVLGWVPNLPWINQFEINKIRQILVKCSYKYAIYAKAPPFWVIFEVKNMEFPTGIVLILGSKICKFNSPQLARHPLVELSRGQNFQSEI